VKNEDLLDSWKAISLYLDRNVRTCFRWQKELGLPVHRFDNESSRSKVFAYKSEIDEWLKQKAICKETKKKSFLEKKWAIISLISSLTGVLAVFAFLYFFHTKTSLLSKNPSIAVIPFKNLNASEYDEYFADGIANEIINGLTRLNGFKVVPWASVSSYQSDPQDSQHIGGELDVDYIIKGKIEKRDNRINFDVQLIKTRDNNTIWNRKYNVKLEDFLSIQDNICYNITEKLNIKLAQNLPNNMNGIKTFDPQAFDSYLKGNYVLNKLNDGENIDPWKLYHQGKYYSNMGTQESSELAVNLFEHAIKIDSKFAQAYLGLAQCFANNVNFNWDMDIHWLNKAEDLIKEAQSIYLDLPEYHSTLIEINLLKEICFDINTKEIVSELVRLSIRKYPDHAQLNSIVGYYYFMKFCEEGNEEDFGKALEYKEKSFWQNPYALGNIAYSELLMLNKEFINAIEICNIIKKIDYSLMSNFRLGEIYYYLGDLDKSKAIFQQMDSTLESKIESLFNLAMIASQKGNVEEVKKIIQEINILSPSGYRFSLDHFKLASVYFGLGMKEIGYKELKSFFAKTVTQKYKFLYHKYIDVDKNYDKFKNDEEFKKIIKGDDNG